MFYVYELAYISGSRFSLFSADQAWCQSRASASKDAVPNNVRSQSGLEEVKADCGWRDWQHLGARYEFFGHIALKCPS